ncbi:hypothetical protein HYV86_06910 [Candidatus Woesearchaeota archaeon]|nr:hypothetical protein [Candidatus Woesearchaeota archaeon]
MSILLIFGLLVCVLLGLVVMVWYASKPKSRNHRRLAPIEIKSFLDARMEVRELKEQRDQLVQKQQEANEKIISLLESLKVVQ